MTANVACHFPKMPYVMALALVLYMQGQCGCRLLLSLQWALPAMLLAPAHCKPRTSLHKTLRGLVCHSLERCPGAGSVASAPPEQACQGAILTPGRPLLRGQGTQRSIEQVCLICSVVVPLLRASVRALSFGDQVGSAPPMMPCAQCCTCCAWYGNALPHRLSYFPPHASRAA